MDVQIDQGQREKVHEFQVRHRAGLLTLVFTDIVGSTRLKHELGDSRGVDLILRHHAVLRSELRRFPQAEEISTAGDSFFVVFNRPSDAVRFALNLVRALHVLARETGVEVFDRIGIHVGEVVIHQAVAEDGGTDLYGIQIDLCARLMSLGVANQILLSRHAFDLARQAIDGRDSGDGRAIAWLHHGPYALQGVEEPVEVCEVRESSDASTAPPSSSDKCRRLNAGSDMVPGWRPAVGEMVPDTHWKLQARLGEGGFGEVWSGQHERLKEFRVFKFCFRIDRVRALKREMTLLRLLRDRIGEHPHIVRLLDVFLDEPPFYLEFEHNAGLDLAAACRRVGGPSAIPVEVRIEWIAQAAEGLEAAHRAGVIHRDIKPSNILVCGPWSGPVPAGPVPATLAPGTVKLMDFGIGQVLSEEFLAGLTRAGFTETLLVTASHPAGTQLYLAPELLVPGREATPQSDLFSLGVVLFQLLAGDLGRPLTTEWAEAIGDPLLREDLRLCFSGRPADRHPSARHFADRLRALPERRRAREQERERQVERERAAYRRGLIRAGVAAGLLLALVGSLALWALREASRADSAADSARLAESAERAERLRVESERGRARRLLAGFQVDRGNRLLDEGDLHGALVWYSEALRLDRDEPSRNALHRFRIGSALRDSPVPLAMVSAFPDGAPFAQPEALSGDGRIYAAIRADGRIVAWDVGTGEPVGPAFGPPAGSDPGTTLLLDAAGSIAYVMSAGRWQAWQVATGRPVNPAWLPSGAYAGFSSDGRRALVLHANEVVLADPEAGRAIRTLATERGFAAGSSIFSFSANGAWILERDWRNRRSVRVLSAATGETAGNILSSRQEGTEGDVDPDGVWLALGTSDGDVLLISVQTGKTISVLRRHQGAVIAVAFSPDRRVLATSGADQSVVLWDLENRRPLGPALVHRTPARAIVFSRDGQRLLTWSEDQTMRVWQVSTGNPTTPWIRHGVPGTATFRGDTYDVVAVGHGFRTWGLPRSRQQTLLESDARALRSVRFDPGNGRAVITQLRNDASLFEGDFHRRLHPPFGHEGRVLDAWFSRDGQRLVTEGDDPRVWDPVTGKPLTARLTADPDVERAALSPTGRRAVRWFRDGSVQVWDPVAMKAVSPRYREFPSHDLAELSDDDRWLLLGTQARGEGPGLGVWPASGDSAEPRYRGIGELLNQPDPFSPGGRYLVIRSLDDEPRVLLVDLLKATRWIIPELEPWDCRVRFDPSATRFAVVNRGKLRLYDPAEQKPLGPVIHLPSDAVELELAPDGRHVAVAFSSGTTQIWDGETGRPTTPPMPHGDLGRAWIFFAPDSLRLLTLSEGGRLRLWDAVAGGPLGPPTDTFAAVTSAGVRPDLGFAVTSFQYLTRIWDLRAPAIDAAPEEIIAWAQSLAAAAIDETGSLASLRDDEREVRIEAGWKALRPRLSTFLPAVAEVGGNPEAASADLPLPILPRAFTLLRGPESAVMTNGQPVRLEVIVEAPEAGSLTYQWRRDGAPLVARTNAVLELPAGGADRAGSYSVTIRGDGGALTSPAARVGPVAPDPDLAGQWDFDHGSLAATLGWDLAALPGTALPIAAGTALGLTSELGLPDIGGRPARVLRFSPGDRTVGLVLRHGIPPKNPEGRVNQYTLVLDVLFRNPDNHRFGALAQIDDLQNRNDADLFTSWTNRVGGIGISEIYGGASEVRIGQWHRLAFAVDAEAQTPVIGKYIDGLKHADQVRATGLEADGRFSLRSLLLLFADDNGELLPGAVNSIQIYRRRLTDDEIARLGAPTAEGLPLRLPPAGSSP